MFDFFRKKRSDSKEIIPKGNEREERSKEFSKIGATHAINQSVNKSVQEAQTKFAKPDQYNGNRTIYDSAKAKVNAKNSTFADVVQVKDPYTGSKLVLTIKEAKELYKEDWASHLAESDHVVPLKQIHEQTKNNTWNTVDDIKDVANSEKNVKVVSRKFNNAKRSRTNTEFVENEEYLRSKNISLTEDGRQQAIFDEQEANRYIKNNLRGKSIKNAVHTGHEAGVFGAQNAGVSSLTISGIINITAIIKGEKTAMQAVEDTMKDGGKAAVSGYISTGGVTIFDHSLLNSSSKLLNRLGEMNVTGKVITAVMVTGDTLRKWSDGEITTQECMIDLGEKGLSTVTAGYSALLGQSLIPIPIVGGAIGALVGSAMTSSYYRSLINTLQVKELEHQERMRIIAECHEAAEQAKIFRKELERYIQNYLSEYRECFHDAISSMKFSYQVGDVEGVVASANEITRKLGGQVKFETVDEFASFLDSDEDDEW